MKKIIIYIELSPNCLDLPENSLRCKTVKISCTFKDKIKDILEKFRSLNHNYDYPLKLLYKGKYLNENLL